MRKYKCEKCEEEVDTFKRLKKICGERVCKKCAREIRLKRREETFENSPDKEAILELKRKESREYQKKKRVEKARAEGRELRQYGVPKDAPIIKGSRYGKPKQQNKSSSYLTFHEKQNLFRILINKGIEGEEAKDRISNLVKEQSRVRNLMREQGKSEEDIKIKQQEMLEELWNY